MDSLSVLALSAFRLITDMHWKFLYKILYVYYILAVVSLIMTHQSIKTHLHSMTSLSFMMFVCVGVGGCGCVCKPAVLSASTVKAGHSHTKRHLQTHTLCSSLCLSWLAGHQHMLQVVYRLTSCCVASRDGWLVITWYAYATNNSNLQLTKQSDTTSPRTLIVLWTPVTAMQMIKCN